MLVIGAVRLFGVIPVPTLWFFPAFFQPFWSFFVLKISSEFSFNFRRSSYPACSCHCHRAGRLTNFRQKLILPRASALEFWPPSFSSCTSRLVPAYKPSGCQKSHFRILPRFSTFTVRRYTQYPSIEILSWYPTICSSVRLPTDEFPAKN